MFRPSLAFRPETAVVHPVPPMAVALQGGGALGAFSWGVLDRLFEEEDFLPAALSGASAGAINAVVAAHGLLEGGPEGARAGLRNLWTELGQMSRLSPLGLPGGGLQVELLTHVFSPYQFNPLNLNPVRDLLVRTIDFDRLNREGRMPLFISATNVRTGQPRIFRENELSIDVLMASTCIPHFHQAVEIEGERYWDGGFSSNPPILPMVLESPCNTLLIVKLTPDEEPELPVAASDIFGRMRRILFNATLIRDIDGLRELRAVLGCQDRLPEKLRRVRDLTVETVAVAPEVMAEGSPLDPRPEFLERLREAGYEHVGEILNRLWTPARRAL